MINSLALSHSIKNMQGLTTEFGLFVLVIIPSYFLSSLHLHNFIPLFIPPPPKKKKNEAKSTITKTSLFNLQPLDQLKPYLFSIKKFTNFMLNTFQKQIMIPTVDG